MKKLPAPRPFLKWAGGKNQISNELLKRIPESIRTYHEPFVGGGAFFFRLHRAAKIGRSHLSDLNPELMDAYLAVRDHVEDVIDILVEYPHDKEFYYQLRSADPSKMELTVRTARMIYLNKTGYNGLYRVNQDGKFNVPFGRYKNPGYCDPENLRAASYALRDVEITCSPFEQVLKKVGTGDFVYFDPPYVPLSRTANFTAYYADGFDYGDQVRLRDVCLELDKMHVNFMLSNSALASVRELYTHPGFFFEEILASRAINRNGSGRGKVPELLVTNYVYKI